VTPRPFIFISAVSRELHSARQLVANTLTFLGYQPIWQDIFGTESGDLREMLRKQIDQSKGVVQLVGKCYGAEPSTPDETFGRVSYTQYEALYARSRGKKTWYLFIGENFPADTCEGEPEELQKLQADYRTRLQSDSHVFHSLTTTEGLEASVLKLRDDLTRLRRGVKQWAIGITALLLVIVGLVAWQLHSQSQIKAELAKLREGVMQYPQMEAQVRGSRSDTNPAAIQDQVYVQLAKQLGVDSKLLREKLPQFAAQLKQAPNVSTYERANASYVAKDFVEAERLALQASQEALAAQPPNSRKILESLELAGLAAREQIQYARAMDHFRKAEPLTDATRDPEGWARLQDDIADLLVADGKYREAEKLFRTIIAARSSSLGPEHPDTLDSRHRLIYALTRQTRFAEAEREARDVLKLREKVLGPEHTDTLVSRYNLAEPLVSQGKYEEAEALYRTVIQLNDKVLGPEHPRTLAARVGLATLLGDEGKNAEAEPLYRDIIRLDDKVYGREHPYTLNDRQNLATTLQADGKYAEAEKEYRDVIRMDGDLIGPEHPDTLTCRNNLAELLDDEKKYAEAEAECRRIIPAEEKALGPDNQQTLNSRGNLAMALIAQGKFPEAQSEYKDVIDRMERVLGVDHPDTFRYASKFMTTLVQQNRAVDARSLGTHLQNASARKLGSGNASARDYGKLLAALPADRR
jgi:tetratricopeptide (TPR) repeat protein